MTNNCSQKGAFDTSMRQIALVGYYWPKLRVDIKDANWAFVYLRLLLHRWVSFFLVSLFLLHCFYMRSFTYQCTPEWKLTNAWNSGEMTDLLSHKWIRYNLSRVRLLRPQATRRQSHPQGFTMIVLSTEILSNSFCSSEIFPQGRIKWLVWG